LLLEYTIVFYRTGSRCGGIAQRPVGRPRVSPRAEGRSNRALVVEYHGGFFVQKEDSYTEYIKNIVLLDTKSARHSGNL